MRSRDATAGDWRVLHHSVAVLKIAVRIKETTTRIRLAFAANCPDAALFRELVGALIPRPT